jgi:tRNA A-37 threonylcarbamoyl transferase component Bud32
MGGARDPVLDSGVVTDLRNQLQHSLGEAYRLERELGGGGMSRVFLAVETALGRQVVVKVLLPELAASVSVDRFRREIQLAAQLSHPHIVPLLAAGDAGGLPWFTMPYVTGESLRNRLLRDRELPVVDTIRILRDVASALAYAHGQGVVHRDIKPDNVLLSHGVAVVTDFGVAKALTASADAMHSGLTSMGVTLGTPAYMAPEQCTADPGLDHRVDIYAYGIMAYEMLTGQTPFHGRTPHAMLGAHMAAIPEPITQHRPGIPPVLAHLVMKCLEKRPADRLQTATELMQTIDMLTTPSGGTIPLRAVTPAVTVAHRREDATAQRLAAGARRRWIGLGALALAIVAGVVVWIARGSRVAPERSGPVAAAPIPAPVPAPISEAGSPTEAAPAPPPVATAAAGDSAATQQPADAAERRSTPAPSRIPTNPDEAALLARLRRDALAARSRAAAAGAAQQALARGDSALAAADSLRGARKTVGAAARLSMATTIWNDAADEARHAAPPRDSMPAPPAAVTTAPAPAAPPAPPPAAAAPRPVPSAPTRPGAPVPPTDPAPAIRAVFADYAQAIEARSIPAIRRVYPGLSPAQSKEWEEFFGAVSAIDVDLAVSDLSVSGDSADARLSGVYVFQNPGSRRTVREPVSFQAHLRRQGGDWRIETLR